MFRKILKAFAFPTLSQSLTVKEQRKVTKRTQNKINGQCTSLPAICTLHLLNVMLQASCTITRCHTFWYL